GQFALGFRLVSRAPATTRMYPLSLHDALPIFAGRSGADRHRHGVAVRAGAADGPATAAARRLGAAEPGLHRPAGVGHAPGGGPVTGFGEGAPMGEITDIDALRRAMAENAGQPEGPARNARAEQLLAEAEKLNLPLAVIEALGHQLQVYNYSSEK